MSTESWVKYSDAKPKQGSTIIAIGAATDRPEGLLTMGMGKYENGAVDITTSWTTNYATFLEDIVCWQLSPEYPDFLTGETE